MTPYQNFKENSTNFSNENAMEAKPFALPPRKYQYLYLNMLVFAYLHISAFYGLFIGLKLMFNYEKVVWISGIFHTLVLIVTSISVTAGNHRLWAHRTYKAKLPLQILLMILSTVAFQKSIIYWVRDHRTHHKYSDTDADPHNARRGFFYSHMGWIFVKSHPDVIEKGNMISLQDLYSNPVLMFQKKYVVPLVAVLTFGLPTVIPYFFWGENLFNSWHYNMLRFMISLHGTCTVNSVAHMWGTKPFDKDILPVENVYVSLFTSGEGYHNYHHAFPQDYRAAELGSRLNVTKKCIDFFARIGWAYDLKTVSEDVVKAKALRSGDGSFVFNDDKCY